MGWFQNQVALRYYVSMPDAPDQPAPQVQASLPTLPDNVLRKIKTKASKQQKRLRTVKFDWCSMKFWDSRKCNHIEEHTMYGTEWWLWESSSCFRSFSICLTPDNAACERGFSVMNEIKTGKRTVMNWTNRYFRSCSSESIGTLNTTMQILELRLLQLGVTNNSSLIPNVLIYN